MRFVALTCLAVGFLSCNAYDYEEEVFLDVEGSGRIRVSGSTEILEWVHGIHPVTRDAMRARFEDPRLEIDSIRETRRGGRRFLHLQGHFADWNELCEHPAFRNRHCRLSANDDGELELHFSLPPAPTPNGVPSGIAPDAILAFRFHVPGRVHFHNSRASVERGNILRWQLSAAEYFGGSALNAEVRFERRSVLESALLVLGTALAVVVLTGALTLFLMVRKGRRQLREDAKAGGAFVSGRRGQI